jgi:hypothetical protein
VAEVLPYFDSCTNADRRQELPHFRTVCAPSNQAKSTFLIRNSAVRSDFPAATMQRELLPFMLRDRSLNDS